MKAMVLKGITDLSSNKTPLEPADLEVPVPGKGEVLIRILTCGVCHTELDEIEGRTPPPVFPVVPGHQVVGTVEKTGKGVEKLQVGDRVGVAWIFSSCGKCRYCLEGNDNLCAEFRATGRDVNGGYAEYMTVPENSAFPVPGSIQDEAAAPLLCAGSIGYRSLKLTGLEDGQKLGLTGFGASAHLVLKMAAYKFPRSPIYVFARNRKEQDFARELGAVWAGDTEDDPGVRLDAVIDTTPVWKPVVWALKYLRPEGRLVINAIRKEDLDKQYLLNLSYHEHLWMEREIKSVANVARNDVRELLKLAAEIAIRPEIQMYPLGEANRALIELKKGEIRGAKVLRIQA